MNMTVNQNKNCAFAVGRGAGRGMKCYYNMVTKEKIGKMMEICYQQCTEAKIKWAVRLYKDWPYHAGCIV